MGSNGNSCKVRTFRIITILILKGIEHYKFNSFYIVIFFIKVLYKIRLNVILLYTQGIHPMIGCIALIKGTNLMTSTFNYFFPCGLV